MDHVRDVLPQRKQPIVRACSPDRPTNVCHLYLTPNSSSETLGKFAESVNQSAADYRVRGTHHDLHTPDCRL
jgi:hypothetical protein